MTIELTVAEARRLSNFLEYFRMLNKADGPVTSKLRAFVHGSELRAEALRTQIKQLQAELAEIEG